MRIYVVIIIVLIMLVGLIFVTIINLMNNEEEIINIESCLSKDDCVSATCCHPDSVVNKEFGPNCSGIFCSQDCQGPLDCGAGSIECLENKCEIVPN